MRGNLSCQAAVLRGNSAEQRSEPCFHLSKNDAIPAGLTEFDKTLVPQPLQGQADRLLGLLRIGTAARHDGVHPGSNERETWDINGVAVRPDAASEQHLVDGALPSG